MEVSEIDKCIQRNNAAVSNCRSVCASLKRARYNWQEFMVQSFSKLENCSFILLKVIVGNFIITTHVLFCCREITLDMWLLKETVRWLIHTSSGQIEFPVFECLKCFSLKRHWRLWKKTWWTWYDLVECNWFAGMCITIALSEHDNNNSSFIIIVVKSTQKFITS